MLTGDKGRDRPLPLPEILSMSSFGVFKTYSEISVSRTLRDFDQTSRYLKLHLN